MKAGDIVKNKHTEGLYGVIRDSRLGLSVHFKSMIKKGLHKTLGYSQETLEEFWEVVDELPDDYEIGKYGVPLRKEKVNEYQTSGRL